jgi:ATP-binding cassette subfamily C protein
VTGGVRPGPNGPSGSAGDALRFVAREILRRRRALVLLLAWSLLESAPALASGRLIAAALDDGFLRGRPVAGLVLLLTLGAVTLLGALAVRGMYPRLGDIVEPLRDALVTAIVRGALMRAEDRGAQFGPLGAAPVARLTRQVETVRDVVAGQLLVVRQFAVTGIAVCVGVASLAMPLALLVAVPLAASLLGFAALLKPMIARQHAAFIADERVAALSGVAVEGLRDITAAGVERRVADGVDEAIEEQYRLSRALAGYGALRRVIVVLGGNVPVLLILVAARALLRHGLSAGALVGALTYVTVNLEPALRTLVQGVGASALRLSVAVRRIGVGGFESEAVADSSDEDGDAPGRSPTPSLYAIEVEQLGFRYGPHAEPVVRDLTIAIGRHECLAIVGPSGAGKSTLVNLLSGLLRPDAGLIRLAGAPLDGIPAGSLPRIRMLIPQEAYLFGGTLRENLCYLRPDATDEQVARVAARLGADGLVDRLGGLDAPLNPALLSAGQRQLVALVRAYLSSASLVLLDEATCHLDHAAERRAEDAFRERPGALVLVAHRIGSARRADRVLLLDGERTVLGTHEELIAGSRLYAELVGHWHSGDGDDAASAGSEQIVDRPFPAIAARAEH